MPVSERRIEVEVVWVARDGAPLRQSLSLPVGTSALDAVRASGLLQRLGVEPGAELSGVDGGVLAAIGVWGRHLDGKKRQTPEQYRCRDGDRIELYRHLPVPPKEARKRRLAARRALGKKN